MCKSMIHGERNSFFSFFIWIASFYFNNCVVVVSIEAKCERAKAIGNIDYANNETKQNFPKDIFLMKTISSISPNFQFQNKADQHNQINIVIHRTSQRTLYRFFSSSYSGYGNFVFPLFIFIVILRVFMWHVQRLVSILCFWTIFFHFEFFPFLKYGKKEHKKKTGHQQ